MIIHKEEPLSELTPQLWRNVASNMRYRRCYPAHLDLWIFSLEKMASTFIIDINSLLFVKLQ